MPGRAPVNARSFTGSRRLSISRSVSRRSVAAMNKKLFSALKPGGMLVIADHSAAAGAGTDVGKSLHRIEEVALRREVEAAGFKLVGEADFLRRPGDTRDFPSTRPTGPVDEFVLKFQRPN